MINVRDLDDAACPKCDGEFALEVEYIPDRDVLHITCPNCGYEFDAEPADKHPAEHGESQA